MRVAEGRQIMLLRKGGIIEAKKGFSTEHREFLMYPTYLHQNAAMLKAREHHKLSPVLSEPDQVKIACPGSLPTLCKHPDVPLSMRWTISISGPVCKSICVIIIGHKIRCICCWFGCID